MENKSIIIFYVLCNKYSCTLFNLTMSIIDVSFSFWDFCVPILIDLLINGVMNIYCV